MLIFNILVVMRKTEKDLLRKQVDVFVHWRLKKGGNTMYQDWLSLFVSSCPKVDIMDITQEDVNDFLAHAYVISRTQSGKILAKKAIEGLMVFYGARNRSATKRDIAGRPPHLDQIQQVQKYREMGLKYREIERLTGKDVKQIHRWINYAKELKNKIIK